MILGISAGRKNRVTESTVGAVLDGAGGDTEFVSLAGKLIRPCEACNGCVDDNTCVLDDDFTAIEELVHECGGLVFGAPTYWATMNSKGQAFWERLSFSTRHNALFPFSGTPAAMAAVDGKDGTGEYVLADLKRYFADAGLETVGTIAVQGEYACFTCGYGSECAVGGLAGLYPLGTGITDEIIPSLDNQKPHLEDDRRGPTSARGEAHGLGGLLRQEVDARR